MMVDRMLRDRGISLPDTFPGVMSMKDREADLENGLHLMIVLLRTGVDLHIPDTCPEEKVHDPHHLPFHRSLLIILTRLADRIPEVKQCDSIANKIYFGMLAEFFTKIIFHFQ